jgi:probable phosphoglycerate mutase
MSDLARARRFIIRHAQSAANAGKRTTDPATVPITEMGIRQARYSAGLIPERPVLVATSSYRRTVQTAEPLLQRYPGVPLEQWPVEEFTYLDSAACAETTYTERTTRRHEYWTRCDPLWGDGTGCECFADFIARVRRFERKLLLQAAEETVVIFTHGLVMRALLWLQQCCPGRVGGAEMADFDIFRRSVSVPNCAVLRASQNDEGRLALSARVSVAHIPVDLLTE